MPNIEGISVQQSNAERKSYVVVGAILSCSSGSQLSRLKMPFSHGVFVKGKPQMNIMDFVPNVNIMPFGKCRNLKNPTVASATSANNGVLTPMPCTPVMTMPWIDGKADKMVGGHPALLNKSTNMCFHCGLIKIEDDGQDLGGVTIGNQSSANSGPSDAGFGQGPACEKPQQKPTMWDNFVKGISKLGDVPAAMQKAASELPGALEKAANDLPKGLQKAAEDLPKGVNLFVQESYVKPIQEDLDTLRDDQLNLADADAVGGIVFAALTAGRNKDIEDIWSGLASVNKRNSKGKEFNPKRTQEEMEDLARDPAQGNQITEKGMIERDIGLDLETRGILSGIKRDPSGAAEFIDVNGTKWDIKGFNSHFPPKKGGFKLDKVIGQIEKEFSKGENVIVDTTKMSSQHIDELRKAIQEKNMSSRILWWP